MAKRTLYIGIASSNVLSTTFRELWAESNMVEELVDEEGPATSVVVWLCMSGRRMVSLESPFAWLWWNILFNSV